MLISTNNLGLPDCKICKKPRKIDFVRNNSKVPLYITDTEGNSIKTIPWAYTIILKCTCQINIKPKEILMQQQFFDWVDTQHTLVGQTYDVHDYSFHTNKVAEIAKHYGGLLLDDSEREIAILAGKAHDIIEDTNNNYNDLVIILEQLECPYSVNVADVVYNVSNELGKNRKERALKTYPKIASCKKSIFVKLCDRIANVRYSVEVNSRLLEVYRKENHEFRKMLDLYPQFKPMWDELDSVFANSF